MPGRVDIDEQQEFEHFELSRKEFIRTTLLAGIAISMPLWLTSCYNEQGQTISSTPFEQNVFQDDEWKIIRGVQETLFPKDELGPGALELYSDRYLVWIMQDGIIHPKEQDYIRKGLERFMTYLTDKEIDFEGLDPKERINLLETYSKGKGKYWLSRLLTLIFESMFADPVYGCNPDGIGWKWLGYEPGLPRPTKETKYPEIKNSIA